MLNLNLPVGDHFGWGVCGKYIAREVANLRPPGQTRLLTTQLSQQAVADEFEFLRLQQLLPQLQEQIDDVPNHPLLQAITGAAIDPIQPELRGSKTVGYTFFEDSRLTPRAIENAKSRFDIVATGSSWCTKILNDHGITNTATVIQGVDPNFFFPHPPTSRILPDHFVIFSGGKFELRKGQDLVIRAFKALQDRHPDVLLVTAWYNQWGFSWQTMSASPYIRFAPRSQNYFENLNQIYSDNGVDPSRTLNLAPRSNQLFPHIYRNTDIGIFPNRCEGGTNLVLMEYMACGKPVIATNSTGHADVITKDNALVIDSPTTKTIVQPDGTTTAQWPEPNLEQTVELLEQAYQNRSSLEPLAQRAAQAMQPLTWTQTARDFLKLL